MRNSSAWVAGGFAVCCAFANSAAANLRAPRHLDQPPSSALALAADAAASLVVTGETLDFSCETSCQVSAIYSVTATAAGEYAFSFVLPQSAAVTAQVNDAPSTLATAEVARIDKLRHDGETEPVEARFRGALRAGANRIVVRYQQPLANHETDYGYFRKGRFIEFFRYELWPLKQWQRAPQFTLRLTVTLPRKPPGFWARHSGKYKIIKCVSVGHIGEGNAPIAGQLNQRESLLSYEATLHDFPDRLECSIGDSDLLTR